MSFSSKRFSMAVAKTTSRSAHRKEKGDKWKKSGQIGTATCVPLLRITT